MGLKNGKAECVGVCCGKDHPAGRAKWIVVVGRAKVEDVQLPPLRPAPHFAAKEIVDMGGTALFEPSSPSRLDDGHKIKGAVDDCRASISGNARQSRSAEIGIGGMGRIKIFDLRRVHMALLGAVGVA